MIRSNSWESYNKFWKVIFSTYGITETMRKKKTILKYLSKMHDIFTLQSGKSNFALSDSNMIQTHNHLVIQQTLSNLAKLALMNELCC